MHDSPVGTRTAAPNYAKTVARSGFAPLNDLQMYYEVHGTGKPLVTLGTMWSNANIFPSLLRGRQQIGVELQGIGRTPDIDRPWSFEQHAEDVIGVLDHLGVDRADVFAECIGGITAMLMALRHPERVGRIALYASPLRSFPESYSQATLEGLAGIDENSSAVQYLREMYEAVAPDPGHWPVIYGKTLAGAGTWPGFSDDELRSIKHRVLYAVGDRDWIPVSWALAWSELFADGQFAVIPNAGHFVLNDDPEKLLPLVAAFLDEPDTFLPIGTTSTGIRPGVTR